MLAAVQAAARRLRRCSRGRSQPGQRLQKLLLLLLVLIGCTEAQLFGPRTALSESEARGKITLTGKQCSSCTWLDDEFYVVQPEQLSSIRGAQSLTYLGTQDGFHFLKAWNKMRKESEIDHVALRLDQCDVASPLSIDEERQRAKRRPG